MDKSRIAIYKKGKEPDDVLFWLSHPAIERIINLEQIYHEYNIWKYGKKPKLQKVVKIIKRKY